MMAQTVPATITIPPIVQRISIMETNLQALGHALELWQALYIIGIILAVLSTFSIIIFNFHLPNKQGLRVSNYVYALAAGLSVLATLAIIAKTRSINTEKDRLSKIQLGELQHETAVANASAAKANADARIADQKAEEAKLKAEQTATANSTLRIEVAKQEAETKKTTTNLAAQNQQTNLLAQGLAQQQQGMAHQMQTVSTISEAQIAEIANQLSQFAGQKVYFSVMMDAHCQRLADQLQTAFDRAGIKRVALEFPLNASYNGVLVAVKNPRAGAHPQFAEALIYVLRSIGIQAQPTINQSLPDDLVGIDIGPE
jgi:hypothetical protein